MSILVDKVTKTYGSVLVLERFSAEFKYGQTTALVGPSGQGKTTLLRIMLGLEQPDSGQITGLENQRASAVFQEDRLCENLSAMANIRLVLGRSVSTSDILRTTAAVGIGEGTAWQPVATLSGGERRRIALVRALMAPHDILFLDEPFKGLDQETRVQVIAFTREQSCGRTVVLVTHDAAECQAMAAQVIDLAKP